MHDSKIDIKRHNDGVSFNVLKTAGRFWYTHCRTCSLIVAAGGAGGAGPRDLNVHVAPTATATGACR